VLAINHQRSTINQLISPFHAPTLAQIAERDYVTLHGLHDSKENKTTRKMFFCSRVARTLHYQK
jgi:hypothetical protein